MVVLACLKVLQIWVLLREKYCPLVLIKSEYTFNFSINCIDFLDCSVGMPDLIVIVALPVLTVPLPVLTVALSVLTVSLPVVAA